MAGIGLEWIHTREFGTTKSSMGGEAVLDFMFWPSRKHKVGWHVEPGYEYNFGRGHERSIVMSVGLFIHQLSDCLRSFGFSDVEYALIKQ